MPLVYWFVVLQVVGAEGAASGAEKTSRCMASVVAVKPMPGWVDVYVYSTCRLRVDTVYFYDPVLRDVLLLVRLVYPAVLEPGRVVRLSIPLVGVVDKLEAIRKPVALGLGTSKGFTLVTSNYVDILRAVERAKRLAWLVMLADRYSRTGIYTYDWWHTHWVVFNFVTGDYVFYSYTGSKVNPAKGPYRGVAPVLTDTDEYLVSCSWVSWSRRPLDSPVVIVFNPTRGLRDWNFTWIDPHRVNIIHLPRVADKPEEVVYDFLVFWEDLWNPYKPPSRVDDWRDHVVRVTLFSNGVVRLQVYIAKGGYLHVFKHLATLGPDINRLGYELCPGTSSCPGFCTSSNPAFDYCKPHGAFWSHSVRIGYRYVGTCGKSLPVYYYEPMPDKLWLVPLSGG